MPKSSNFSAAPESSNRQSGKMTAHGKIAVLACFVFCFSSFLPGALRAQAGEPAPRQEVEGAGQQGAGGDRDRDRLRLAHE